MQEAGAGLQAGPRFLTMVIEIIVTDGVDGRALWQVLQDSVVVAEGREACERWLVANGREWRLNTETQ